jgi:hypothetical protein
MLPAPTVIHNDVSESKAKIAVQAGAGSRENDILF